MDEYQNQTAYSYEPQSTCEAPQNAAEQPVYTAPASPQPAPRKKRHVGRTLLTCLLVAVIAFGAGFAGVKIGFKTQSNVVILQSGSDESGKNAAEQGGSQQTGSNLPVASSGAAAVDTIALAKAIVPTVVAITTEQMTTGSFWGGSYVTSGAGSGVIISSDGYIITSAHVITGATSITVELQNGQKYPATVVGSYVDGDIAVVHIEATGLAAATLGQSKDLLQGAPVYAVGNPEGNFSGSITDGIVSALNRNIRVSVETGNSGSQGDWGGLGGMMDDWFGLFGMGGMYQSSSGTKTIALDVIQFSAAISPGNSGGGLFTADGHLVGIVCAKSSDTSAEGLSFAVPIDNALKISESLIATGSYSPASDESSTTAAKTRAVLGITVMELTLEQAQQYNLNSAGLYVKEVNVKATQEAGLKPGDRIVSIGDSMINNYNDLTAYLETQEPGSKVTVIVDRSGKMVSLEITLQKNTAIN